MKTVYGAMPTSLPAGFFKAVRIPVMAELDVVAGDGRLLDSSGGGVRFMPQSIRFQPCATSGHAGAFPSGTCFEVTIDPDTGEFSGRGFLLDDVNGRLHARMIHTQAQDRNSIDLGDVKARYEEDMSTGDYWIRFYQWKVGATTGVGTPAFAAAHFEVDALTPEELMASLLADDDEIMASLLQDPMEELVASVCPVDVHLIGAPEIPQTADELTASGAIIAPRAAFYEPEADHPQKIIITADRRVYGHLAVWETCHEGIASECVIVPRPSDGYVSFNQPGPLTERGQVQTGPIFAYGGHRRAGTAPTLEQAYGGIENAWCDVRVIEGKFGPWLSGVVRPDVSEETVYAARASRISGHWLGGKLKAIVSVNVEAYSVGGTIEDELAAAFSFSLNDEGVSELVASFPPCLEGAADGSQQLTLVLNVDSLDPDTIATAVRDALGVTVTEAPVDSSAGDGLLAALLLEEPDL